MLSRIACYSRSGKQVSHRVRSPTPEARPQAAKRRGGGIFSRLDEWRRCGSMMRPIRSATGTRELTPKRADLTAALKVNMADWLWLLTRPQRRLNAQSVHYTHLIGGHARGVIVFSHFRCFPDDLLWAHSMAEMVAAMHRRIERKNFVNSRYFRASWPACHPVTLHAANERVHSGGRFARSASRAGVGAFCSGELCS